jgi:peptidoglycan/xylan/chitin deacetylase (PgdA/CDA1 family)
MIGPDESVVPSLMFHSVGLNDSDWMWSHLSEPVESFEATLRLFKARRCTTVLWGEVYEHVAGRRRLAARSVMPTFDDGYLDNWVLVWPLLKRYGMRATVFVSADFIEPDGPPRPTLDDVWAGKLRREDLQVAGFLRPSELERMSRSGVIDIQSHASTHTWLFTDGKLEDVYEPSKYSRYPWMAWNARPERKPFYLTEDQSGFVPAGEPIFTHRKALIARQFTPAREAVETFKQEWIRERAAWQGAPNDIELRRRVLERAGLTAKWPGSFETDDERRARVAGELGRSRKVLSRITGRNVDFLCWPGGAYDDVAMQAARDCGYKAFTLGSTDQSTKRNRPGENAETLKRMGSDTRLVVKGIDCGERGARFLWLKMRAHQQSLVHRAALFGLKARAYASAKVAGVRA